MDASASLFEPSDGQPNGDRARAAVGGGTARAMRVAGIGVAAVALYGAFRDVNPRAFASLLDSVRSSLALVLLPSALALFLECLGWRRAFEILGATPSIFALVKVRVASESVGSLLPLGALWSETAKPPLLSRHAGTSLPTSIAAILARKYMLLTAHGGYLVMGFVFGYGALSSGFERVAGAPWLVGVVLAAAFFVFTGAQLMLIGLRGGRVLECTASAFRRVPIAPLRVALESVVSGARQSDREAARFFRASPREIAAAVAPCLAGWLLEAGETWLLLRLLGVRLDFASVLGVEVLVNLGRQLLVMLPGGLGAQELGYAAFLSTLGVPVETSAAFALLKRGKEAFWILTGLAVLLRRGRHAGATVPTT